VIWNALRMAFRQIARNGSRSALTTLGVLIGVAAVIAMVTLGRSATARVNADLSGLGNNLLFVVPGTPTSGGGMSPAKPFSMEDATALTHHVGEDALIAPTANTGVMAVHGGVNWRTLLVGSTDAYLAVMDRTVATGRRFTEGELQGGAAVCIVGETVRRELFGASDPIGADLRLGTATLRVIATLEPKGRTTFGQDQDDFVLIPIVALHRRFAGNRDVAMMFVSAAAGVDTEVLKGEMETLLRERRHTMPGAEPDFRVRDMKEVTEMLGQVTGVLTSLLAAIAAVSLLVGGIGIMNIMLVSVTERTREIGIRLAVGARGRDVLLQFLVEAMVLSALGGVAGILVGIGGSWVVTRNMELPFVLDQSIVLIAFVFSALVGIAFGFFPARKAARLNPMDALRHEG